MLHRIVSRSVVVLAATAFLASCEDNTTGTPLTPPPASTAVYVTPVEPVDGFTFDQIVILRPNGPDTTIVGPDTTIVGIDTTIVGPDTTIVTDTTVTIVVPDPVFSVVYPGLDESPAEGQVITFNVNLPGFIGQAKDTVDAAGLVSPGFWAVGRPCPPEIPPEDGGFCRPVQRVIATPVAGNTGFIDVDVDTLPPPPPPPLRSPR